MNFHNIIIAFVALICAQLISADTFSLQKCFCVSADEVGYIATYNWTTTKSVVWDSYQSYPRDDDACPSMCGTECNNDRSECWAVPALQCYPRITGEVWPVPPKYSCMQADEGRICGNEQAFEINGKRHPLGMHWNKPRTETLLSCSHECALIWPQKQMRSACSHLNVNKKSKHYDQAVPCGYIWKGNKLYESGFAWWGSMATCALLEYDLDYR